MCYNSLSETCLLKNKERKISSNYTVFAQYPISQRKPFGVVTSRTSHAKLSQHAFTEVNHGPTDFSNFASSFLSLISIHFARLVERQDGNDNRTCRGDAAVDWSTADRSEWAQGNGIHLLLGSAKPTLAMVVCFFYRLESYLSRLHTEKRRKRRPVPVRRKFSSATRPDTGSEIVSSQPDYAKTFEYIKRVPETKMLRSSQMLFRRLRKLGKIGMKYTLVILFII